MKLMKQLFSLLVLVVLVSCKKEEPQPECMCYEYTEKYDPFALDDWSPKSETYPATDFCSKEDGVWTYNANGTERTTTICN